MGKRKAPKRYADLEVELSSIEARLDAARQGEPVGYRDMYRRDVGLLVEWIRELFASRVEDEAVEHVPEHEATA